MVNICKLKGKIAENNLSISSLASLSHKCETKNYPQSR